MSPVCILSYIVSQYAARGCVYQYCTKLSTVLMTG